MPDAIYPNRDPPEEQFVTCVEYLDGAIPAVWSRTLCQPGCATLK